MSIEIKVPVLPESVADATIAKWHKQAGDAISQDETIVDIETDKVVLEVPAPEDGVLSEIICEEGTTVTAEQLIGKLTAGAAKANVTETVKKVDGSITKKQSTAASSEKESAASIANLSPAVRRMVSEHDVDVSKVNGSGKGGRIMKEDIEKHLKQPATSTGPVEALASSSGSRTEEKVPMSRIRQRVAERLLGAQHEMAILTTFNEVDMQAVMNLRKEYKDMFEKAHDVRLGFMSFFVKAAVAALKRFPNVNAYINGTDIIYHNYCDIGVAVSTERGLVVPILRNAENMSMADVEAKITDYALKARNNKLTLDEMTGGTFSITNGGVFGSLLSTPILNPPQSAILGMHKIEQRAVVIDGQIVARPMMYLALSYDHRMVDGKDSVGFLKTIKELLEDPARLLLDI